MAWWLCGIDTQNKNRILQRKSALLCKFQSAEQDPMFGFAKRATVNFNTIIMVCFSSKKMRLRRVWVWHVTCKKSMEISSFSYGGICWLDMASPIAWSHLSVSFMFPGNQRPILEMTMGWNNICFGISELIWFPGCDQLGLLTNGGWTGWYNDAWW